MDSESRYVRRDCRYKNGANGNQLRAGKDHSSLRRCTDEETSIHFVNRMNQDVNVFWLDQDGARQPYGSLKPAEERDQHTFVGHAWLITATNGDVVSVFDAGATGCCGFDWRNEQCDAASLATASARGTQFAGESDVAG